jgi:hypothetical protein
VRTNEVEEPLSLSGPIPDHESSQVGEVCQSKDTGIRKRSSLEKEGNIPDGVRSRASRKE